MATSDAGKPATWTAGARCTIESAAEGGEATNDQEALDALASGVVDPMGHSVHMTPTAAAAVARDHPNATPARIVRAITSPTRMCEHTRWEGTLVYDGTLSLPDGAGRMMVIVEEEAPGVWRVITAFFPDRAGYWTRVAGKEVWRHAEPSGADR